jgi:hypothetical protein
VKKTGDKTHTEPEQDATTLSDTADALETPSRRELIERYGKAEDVRRKVTGNMLVEVYKQRVREQKALIAKAELTKERLLLLTSVMRQLLDDENFITLLRAEGINDMPKQLKARLE